MKKYSKLISGFVVALILAIAANVITGLDIYLMIIVILIGIITISILKMLSLSKEIQELNVIHENHLNEIQELDETQNKLLGEIRKLKENELTRNLRDILGIQEIIPNKINSLQRKPSFLLEATNNIYILGATLKTYWVGANPFTKCLAEAGGKRNVKIQILLLDPKSKYVKEKAPEEDVDEATFMNWIKDTMRGLKRLKEHYEIKNIELYLYDEFPVWNMVITDRRFAKISYYPHERPGSEAPYYVLTNEGKYSLLPPFITYFEKLRERSEKKRWDEIDTE